MQSESDPPRVPPLLIVAVATLSLLFGWWAWAEPGYKVDYPTRGSLAAAGAALLLARWWVYGPRLEAWRHAQLVRRLSTLLLVAWAGAAIGVASMNDAERVAVRKDVHLWSHYHYFLGSKYFNELGYTGLYDQTVAADRVRRKPLVKAKQVRDLETYDKVGIDKVGLERHPSFTDERWEEFQEDVGYFLPRLNWKNILIDRGYNPTPTGNAIYSMLSRVPLQDEYVARIALIDAILLLLAFGTAGWVFGPVRAITAAAWMVLWFGNEHRVIGWPFQYDYVAALIFMACAWRREWYGLAGALLAYAAMVRVFPGLLFGGLVVWAAGWWWTHRSLPRSVVRFGAVFAVACAVLVVAGSFSGRGPGAWVEWTRNISLHADHHRFGDKRIGLQHVFTYADGDDGRWPLKRERYEAWDAGKPWWLLAAAVGGLLWAALAFRGGRRGDDPLVHLVIGLWLVFLGVVLSRYYWSVACLFFLVGGQKRDDARLAPIGAGLLAVVALYYVAASQVREDFGRFFIANLLMIGWWLLVLVGLWWRPAPEPR